MLRLGYSLWLSAAWLKGYQNCFPGDTAIFKARDRHVKHRKLQPYQISCNGSKNSGIAQVRPYLSQYEGKLTLMTAVMTITIMLKTTARMVMMMMMMMTMTVTVMVMVIVVMMMMMTMMIYAEENYHWGCSLRVLSTPWPSTLQAAASEGLLWNIWLQHVVPQECACQFMFEKATVVFEMLIPKAKTGVGQKSRVRAYTGFMWHRANNSWLNRKIKGRVGFIDASISTKGAFNFSMLSQFPLRILDKLTS